MNAYRADGYRHPLYPWLLCGSLGAAACALYYLFGDRIGWRWDLADAAALWVAVTFGLPGLGGLLEGLPLIVGGFMRGFLAADDDQAGDDGAPGPGDSARSVSPLVGGGLLSAWEQYHFDGLLTLLDHAEAADSLTSLALIPAAFADGKHWGYWVGILAASGICHKNNGIATALPAGRTWAWAKRQVRNGAFEAPEDTGADPTSPPHPYREGLKYGTRPKPEKAGKGPEKAAKDDDD